MSSIVQSIVFTIMNDNNNVTKCEHVQTTTLEVYMCIYKMP